MGQSYEVGLSYDIPLSPVRSLRIHVAEDEKAIAEASVADYLCQLKYDAAMAYAEAWRAGKSAEMLEKTYHMLQRIAQSDSVRLTIGDVRAADALQSSLEARTAYGEWLQTKADFEMSLAQLSVYIGGGNIDGLSDSLPIGINDFPVGDELLNCALQNRRDVQMVALSHRLSENNLRLVKAERVPALTLNAAYVHSTEVVNEIAPAPSYDGFSIGFSLPLAFSSMNNGNKSAAALQVEQSSYMYVAAVKQLEVEVKQVFLAYQAAQQVLAAFNRDLLTDAEKILESRVADYNQGNVGLVDLILAEQTYQNLLDNYYSAQKEAFVSEARLLRTIGR